MAIKSVTLNVASTCHVSPISTFFAIVTLMACFIVTYLIFPAIFMVLNIATLDTGPVRPLWAVIVSTLTTTIIIIVAYCGSVAVSKAETVSEIWFERAAHILNTVVVSTRGRRHKLRVDGSCKCGFRRCEKS